MIGKMLKYIVVLMMFTVSFQIAVAKENKFPLDKAYHRKNDIVRKINYWNQKYYNVFYPEVIGYSNNENLPIRSFKIGFNPKEKQFDKPTILIIGQIHSSEPLGLEICMNFAEYLLINHDKNERIKNLLSAFNFYFIPTINPEGFQVVSSGLYANHRKNKTDTNANGRFDKGSDGVDLNRNYPINWNKEIQNKPNEPYYAGKSPASEKETRIMMDLLKRERFYLAVNYHSSYIGDFNERIFFPWNWADNKSPHWYDMRAIATIFSKYLPKDYTEGNYLVHTSTTSKVGFLRDWAYAETGSYFFDIEVGGIYKRKSIIFPRNDMMKQIVDKNINALINTLEYLDLNTYSLRIKDQRNRPLALKEVCHNTLKCPHVKPKKTNEKGYLFLFIPPAKQYVNLYINNEKYHIRKGKQREITLKLK